MDKPAVPESTNTLHEDLESGFPESEAEKLRGLIAACYMMVGVLIHDGAPIPAKWLDVLSAAAHGQPFDEEGLLPFVGTPAASPVAGVSQQDEAQNLRYAKQIAESMARKFYPEVTQWKPLEGDMFGLIMQIDNMQTGLKRARPEGDGWIAVTPETMPEVNDEVWAWLKFGEGLKVGEREYADTSWLQKDGTWALGSAKDFTVTHWRPLPSPPAGEKGGQ